MKKLLILLLLAGCASPRKLPMDEISSLKNELELLKQKQKDDDSEVRYWITSDLCFTELALCRQDKKATEKRCWSTHEMCVVSANKEFHKPK